MIKPVFIMLILTTNLVLAQSHSTFQTSLGCHDNVSDGFWEDIRNATFRIYFRGATGRGYCTGTLINRDVSDSNLDFYFITARHCVKDIDFNAIHQLSFNYQSPSTNNLATADLNRSTTNSDANGTTQSHSVVGFPDLNGVQYLHQSKIDLIAWYFWGDFALCRIQTPVPPHFNVFFAGWNGAPLLVGQNGDGNCSANLYSATHHPSGDIKKFSRTSAFYNLTTPISVGCVWVTNIVQVLFGWIWQNQTSITQICNYVDNPWYIVPTWCDGTVESGSSGSGLFANNLQYFATLSGGVFQCSTVDVSTYGKFKNVYTASAVRSVLNPSGKLSLDFVGMPGRRITCFQNLVLPGASGVSGEYFPSNQYQSDQTIHLQAVDNITTNGDIHIYNGARYEFSAPNIELDPNFEFVVENGAEFIERSDGCYLNALSSKEKRLESFEETIKTKIRELDLPYRKAFDVEKFKRSHLKTDAASGIYPNPSEGIFKIKSSINDPIVEVQIFDVTGKLHYSGVLTQSELKDALDVKGLNLLNGLYFVTVKGQLIQERFKLVLNK